MAFAPPLRWSLLTTAAVVALLAGWSTGCSHTYDGSEKFYDSHPEYQDAPAYMHPADKDD